MRTHGPGLRLLLRRRRGLHFAGQVLIVAPRNRLDINPSADESTIAELRTQTRNLGLLSRVAKS